AGGLSALLNQGKWDARQSLAVLVDPRDLMRAAWNTDHLLVAFYVPGEDGLSVALRARVVFRIARDFERDTSALLALPGSEALSPSIFACAVEHFEDAQQTGGAETHGRGPAL